MFVFDSLNENTELRDNILNDELNDTELFAGINSETASGIIKSVNGVGFDANGNILGNDGKVVVKADELRGHLKTHYGSLNQEGDTVINPLDYDAIEIEGVSLKINDKGEAVNAEGVVVKTVEEVKAIIADNATDEPGTLEEIMAAANQDLGIDFKDEDGNDISFDFNTVEGIRSRDQFIIDKVSKQLAQETIDGVFKQDSDFESLYHYKQANGTSKGWTPKVDYTSVKLIESGAEGSDAQQLDIIIKSEMARGSSLDRAKVLAQYLVDDGKGEDAAKEGLEYLKKSETDSILKSRTETEAKRKQDADSLEEYWSGIQKTINTGVVNGVRIPAFIAIKDANGSVKNVPRASLYEFMSKPINDRNQSALQVYNVNMTNEARIVDALMKMTNYDNSSIVKANVSNEKVKLFRKMKEANSRVNKINNVSGKPANETVVL